MSFVSILATENFLTIMSEGRMMSHDKKVTREDYSKIRRIGNYVLGFGGNLGPCAEFVNTSGLLRPIGNLDLMAENARARIEAFREHKVFVVFGGRNGRGEIEFYGLGTEEMRLLHYKPTGDEISFAFLNMPFQGYDLNNNFIRFLGMTGYQTPEQTLRAQKMLNDDFAAINPVMNTNTFYEVITRH